MLQQWAATPEETFAGKGVANLKHLAEVELDIRHRVSGCVQQGGEHCLHQHVRGRDLAQLWNSLHKGAAVCLGVRG
jgi:hypothetical protein